MIYELRHYIPAKGKEERLRRRFEESTLGLFRALGFRVIEFWVAAESDGRLWYVMEWGSEAEMRDAWDSFRRNEEWLAAKAATEADGPLVEKIESSIVRRPAGFEASQGRLNR